MDVQATTLVMDMPVRRLVAITGGQMLQAAVLAPMLELTVALIEAPLTPSGLENGYASNYVSAGYVA